MSKEIWYTKLKSLVPSWVFEKDRNAQAVFRGMAAVLNQVEQDYKAHIDATKIDLAPEEFVELMGKERSIDRITGEPLPAYRKRVKKIKNRSSLPEIKELIDNLLINGESSINEHSENDFLFMDSGESFCDNGVILTDYFYNAFTVTVPNQTPEPVIFCDNENFMDNEEGVVGSLESSDELFQQIIETIDINKAFGVFYRLFERAS